MKKTAEKIGIAVIAAAVSFGIFSLSCKMKKDNANTVFAQNVVVTDIPEDSMKITQGLQQTFRTISASVLPAVVEVDVEETKKIPANPFGDMSPFGDDFDFFFGNPRNNKDEKKEREYKEKGLGSGVIVRRNGKKIYVLTNNHVAGAATKIKIKLNDEREFDGTLVGTDPRMDIALVSFESDDKNIPVAKLGDSDVIQQGDIVLALGSPLGYFASVTQGIVSATGRSGGQIGSISDFIQTDAAINQGNSGGPLVNIYGEVIGINTWIASQSGGSVGLGFSIPINNIKTSIDQFIEKGKIIYGWIGVSLIEVTDEYKEQLGISKTQTGALASQMFMDSPAMKSGIIAGDFIIAVDGRTVKNVDDLVIQIGRIPAGRTVKFTVIRNKEKKDINVKVEERNEEAAKDNSKLWPGFIALPLTDDIKKELKIEDKNIKGIIVSSVQPKSPASSLRIQNSDIITAVNGKKINSVAEFYKELDTNGKKEIWFDIYSDGHTISTGHFKF